CFVATDLLGEDNYAPRCGSPANLIIGKGSSTMNTLLARLVGGAVALTLSALVLCPPAKADARADIKALEDRFIAAVTAKDLDAIMKVYVPDQTLFVFDVEPPRQYVGAEAYRKDWQAFLDSFK